MQIALQQIQAEQARQEARVAQEEQRRLQEQALDLQRQQADFQREQAEYVRQTDQRMQELAERPAPAAPPPAATVLTGNAGTIGAAADQTAVESRRQGRRALRIDLNAPQMAGATGLNVPRG
ncbi:hypothetical protein [Azorhizobium caulinodans]|uniref:hypothetical protein n=1 Tax=Azorhizobium caulinodans TaxID=7 RepID=UPI0005C70CEC|nr:hypothetical protein [Azorhizobium caulinodans]